MLQRRILFSIISALILSSFLNYTRANNECKSTVMEIVMENCHGSHLRLRRHDEENQEMENREQLGTNQRYLIRRASTAPGVQVTVTNIGSPLVVEIYQGIYSSVSNDRISLSRDEQQPTIHPFYRNDGKFQLSENKMSSSWQPIMTDNLSETDGGNLGFDLTTEELNDLLDEIIQRMPRSLWTKEKLIQLVAKCCQNPELCRKQPPCL